MNRFVVDCSVTMAWCFDDETSSYTNAVLDAVLSDEAVVPGLWPLEVANVLVLAERHRRLTHAKTSRFLEILRGLPIQIDAHTAGQALKTTIHLARSEGLTVYDAAYLELAVREGIELATQDRSLRRAAGRIGVTIFKGQPLREL